MKEVFGGITLGIVLGYIAFRLMKSITDFQTKQDFAANSRSVAGEWRLIGAAVAEYL